MLLESCTCLRFFAPLRVIVRLGEEVVVPDETRRRLKGLCGAEDVAMPAMLSLAGDLDGLEEPRSKMGKFFGLRDIAEHLWIYRACWSI
jgi:hypothetical protein